MNPASRAIVLAVRGYQLFVSPLLPRSCRFAPTCSEYAAQAIAQHGATRGIALTVRRLVRCHPFHAGGYDPPPMPRRKD